MTDLYGSDDAEEASGAKENFIGRVVDSAVDSDDIEVDTGANIHGSDEYESDIDVLYIVEPLTEYTDTDHFYELSINVSRSPASKWQILAGHVENMNGKTLGNMGLASAQDLCDWFRGRVFEFRDITFEEDETFTWEMSDRQINIRREFQDMENKPNPLLVPVREVGEDELAELEIDDGDDEAEVDNVEF
jgi:hypothetical protein